MAQSPTCAPEAWKTGNVCYSTGLTLEIAKNMLEAAEEEAKKQHVPMTVAISDSGGNLLAFHRMDNAILMSVQIAIDKAFTSVFGKQHTAQWRGAFREGRMVPLFVHERWITFPGGFPIIKDGILLGGLGVSGGIVEDLYVAKAALKAGGFSVAEVDSALAEAAGEETKKKQ